MKKIYFLLIIAMVGCISRTIDMKSSEVHPVNLDPADSRFPAGYGAGLEGVSANDLSFRELKDILETHQFDSIEELLRYLNKAKPAYMSHYTLGYDSRSLHGSSKEFPRAIVYGERANFIITFNGHPKQDAYNMLETVEFNYDENRFEFREIAFSEGGKFPVGSAFKISEVGGSGGKCLHCHSDSRPIWEPYPTWPGFYGADDDKLFGMSAREPALRMEASDSVKAEWNEFFNRYSKKGRYQYLRPLVESTVYRGYGVRPNASLNFLLYQKNFLRISRIIKENISPSFKAVYLYATHCYPRIFEENRKIAYQNYYLKESERKPILEVPGKLHKLASATQAELEKEILDHQVYIASRLFEDNQYDDAKFRQFWEHQFQLLLKPVPFTPKMKRLDLLRAIIVANEGYVMDYRVLPIWAVVVGLTNKYFPKANTSTWPATLYEGVHMYHTGSAKEVHWIQEAVRQAFYTPEEQEQIQIAAYSHKFERWYPFCQRLLENFPPQLRD